MGMPLFALVMIVLNLAAFASMPNLERAGAGGGAFQFVRRLVRSG